MQKKNCNTPMSRGTVNIPLQWLTMRCCNAEKDLQHTFVKRHLARQPSMPFRRTKKLLSLQGPHQCKRVMHVDDLPELRLRARTASPGSKADKPKRKSSPIQWKQGRQQSQVQVRQWQSNLQLKHLATQRTVGRSNICPHLCFGTIGQIISLQTCSAFPFLPLFCTTMQRLSAFNACLQ